MEYEAASATLNKAAQLLKARDIQGTQQLLIETLKKHPDFEQGWFLLSFTLQDRDQKEFALRRALEINPDFKAARNRLTGLESPTSDSTQPERSPVPKVEAQLLEARDLLESGNPQDAQRVLRALLKSDPDQPQAWYLFSFTETHPRPQISLLRQALRIDPNYEPAQLRLQTLTKPVVGPSPATATPDKSSKIAPKPASKISRVRQTSQTFLGMGKYMLRRALIIAATIVIGVYLTVLITNKGGQIDDYVRRQVAREAQNMSSQLQGLSRDEREVRREEIRSELEKEAGLELPPTTRNLLWTYKALRFDWDEVVYLRNMTFAGATTQEIDQVRTLVGQYLSNTLLLFGVANLLVFLIGLPLALWLASRGKGRRLDRLISMLSPLSSVPSWVHGIMLVTIFAVILGVLPFGGKYDNIPPDNRWGYIPIVTKHMILPVTAILLSMIFQLVYSWRTFFLIYSDEDYVELALAKGLSRKTLERRYILRPSMPFVITSFALTLVGFWQMSTALEYFFNWPGIGLLYVRALPNFWGENFFPGEVSVILSVVVLFAFLLGAVVFALDITYAAIDPRVRIGSSDNGYTSVSSGSKSWQRPRTGKKSKASKPKSARTPLSVRLKLFYKNFNLGLHSSYSWVKSTLREIRKYPSAILGLSIIAVFVLVSLYTVIAYPYLEIGSEWRGSSISERVYLPKNVPAEWTNWFRKNDLPTTMILRSQDGTLTKTVEENENGNQEILFSASFDYPYATFPQDLYLYMDTTYQEKRPYLSILWRTPDGREFTPKSPTNATGTVYIFSENLDPRRLVRQNENWQNWFVTQDQNHTPEFYLLFADPEADTPKALPGTYQVEISALTFEEDTDVDVELVLFGRVYGSAGTDYMRRDLIVPLLWGLPFTLAFGVTGAILTIILAMIIAAAGVWFGGWFDNGIQRLTEANMILPILAVGILVFAFYGISLWVIMGVIILLNVFGSPTKSFRAGFLQIKEAPYIEAARAYGASNTRIIFKYMIPKIIPVLIPQLVALIPALVFLEATLGMFNVFDPRYPTWGRVIYESITRGALWGGSAYWVLEPISLLLLIGVSFALIGFALERVLNPRLQDH
jgi:peptide/nickel transport system permease protein